MPKRASLGQSRSIRVYEALRTGVLSGRYQPGQALKPQGLADELGVSLAVVRESLLRLVGEGLAERFHNKGFAVPLVSAERWQEIAEARANTEPNMLRLAIQRGDLAWEARVRAAHHTLSRTAMYDGDHAMFSEAWAVAHHDFHRALLEGCGNSVLLDTFERFWTASELARRWSVTSSPDRDIAGEHQQLEHAALTRQPDRAATALAHHLGATAAALLTITTSIPAQLEKGA
ncbi:GntR family transcriptional regulator [Curtobacterium sp. MCBA15_013]|uniref:GntR family transcriptional regulator n=1 Tax=Curtobacterium sp. MCBA15_013 TaxID=1898739 RepID=UPI0008DE27BA|nr:GntR family transcriptional regulator [Curtobacterium sp. MCBA15_013]OII18408.1 GntR family transcriptional regulator [Curtobacterium sp. MCBA15_013]